MTDFKLKSARTTTLIILAITLAACSGAPEKDTQVTRPQRQVGTSTQPGEISLQLPTSEFSAEFAAADYALSRFDWMQAEIALAPVEEQILTRDDATYLGYQQARIAWLQGNQQQTLDSLRTLDQPGAHPALVYRLRNMRRHILELQGEHLASAQLGTRLLSTTPQADRAALSRDIWRNLQREDPEALAGTAVATSDTQLKGWRELALISRQEPTQIKSALQQWQMNYPGHPAADPLPGGLSHLLGETATLDTVALMLPLSGRLAPAGSAIRDGYLAHYYAARINGPAPRDLLILDSDNYHSPLEAYNDAVLQGANLVIGPLSKQAVGQLAALPQRPVPVVALNRIDGAATAGTSALVQLSLAPEDEATRIAEIAFGQGGRRALILRPAGAWGNKMELALQQRWSSLGGSVANSVSYNNQEDYSANMKAGLGLEASDSRRLRVRDMLAADVEFTPRRRQDLDVVFLLARDGAQARSVKPLLAFHYAGDLPVYATSSIYSGFPDERDKDLDGTVLVDSPWLLGHSPALRVAITMGGTGSDSYTRLNALGADAFLLQTRLSQLRAGPDVLLQGNTGLLSLNPQLQILREPAPATFDGGALKPL